MSTLIPAPPVPPPTLADLEAKIEALQAQQNAPKAAGIWSTVLTHWKSTANGVLALGITVGLALLATGSTLLTPKMTTYITLGLAVARAITGAMSKDASALTAADIQKQTAVATAKQA
jgi:L-2-hydroxyglutarate oxidase LhgO